MADEEKRQLARTLKQEFDDKQARLRNLEQQRRAVEASLRRAAYTAAQLHDMPDDVRTYRSVGKAYFLQPKGAVMAQLEEMVNGSDAELKKLGSNREVLVKATESLRSELTEIITSLRRG